MGRTMGFIVMLAAGLVGCAGGAPQRPDWVSGNPAAYPADRFLVGRGQAPRAAVARDRARADLAKVFRVRVSEESRDLTSVEIGQTGRKDPDTRYRSEVARSLVAHTDAVLEGVEIASQWQDPDTGDHHALAVLDRLRAANALRRQLDALDETVRRQVAQARQGDDLAGRIRAARRAVTAAAEREGVARSLRVVSATGTVPEPPVALARLAADLDALLARVRVVPSVVRDDVGGLERVLSSAAAGAGLTVSSGNDPGAYALEGTLDATEFQDERGWHWVRGTLEVTVRRPDTRAVVTARRWPLKASALQPEEARRRLLARIDELLRAEILGVLGGTPPGRNN